MDIIGLGALCLAVFAFIKLRSILGDHGGDHARQKPYIPKGKKTAQNKNKDDKDEKIATSEGSPNAKEYEGIDLPPVENSHTLSIPTAKRQSEEQIKVKFLQNPNCLRILLEIYTRDKKFDTNRFVESAAKAYEMIVTAFGIGDRKSLKSLLSKKMYTIFAKELRERDKRGEKHEFTFIALSEKEILEAEIDKDVACIKMRFEAEFFKTVYDADNVVIEGSQKKLCKVRELWSFQRNLKSRDPAWYLVGTSVA